MRTWMVGAVLVMAIVGGGGSYYWFMVRTPEAVALCEHIVKETLAVSASYRRTGSETTAQLDDTSTTLRFDAVTRGGLPRSMAAECQMSKTRDTIWQLPDTIHVNVNGEDIPDDFARTFARQWASLRDGDDVDAKVAYQRAIQLADEVLKPAP